jgi:tetratricopeptide (TPR) repeat protein
MLNNLIRNMLGRKPAEAPEGAPDSEVLAAKELLAKNRFADVLQVLAPHLQRRPDHAEALFMRGTAQLEMQRNSEARTDLARAVELSPREPRYLYNLALTHWIEGDVDRTMQLCREAVDINGFALAHLLLANIELHGEDYFRVLARVHLHLKPRTYVEVGVFRGWSMRMVPPETQAIGIDPEPRLDQPPGPNQRVIAQTSDDYFAQHDVIAELGGRRIELAFIDGMHHFEYALRDFINIERLCGPDSVILVHDCYPLDRQTAERERSTAFWSGDIWRLILLLRKYRPDLAIRTIATPPTGLGMIFNLDPTSRVLADRLDEIVAEFLALDYGTLDGGKRHMLNACPNDWPTIAGLLDSRRRPS